MSSTDILDGDYRTGQIKVYGPADFEGMRVAGKLAADAGVEVLVYACDVTVEGVRIARPIPWSR